MFDKHSVKGERSGKRRVTIPLAKGHAGNQATNNKTHTTSITGNVVSPTTSSKPPWDPAHETQHGKENQLMWVPKKKESTWPKPQRINQGYQQNIKMNGQKNGMTTKRYEWKPVVPFTATTTEDRWRPKQKETKSTILHRVIRKSWHTSGDRRLSPNLTYNLRRQLTQMIRHCHKKQTQGRQLNKPWQSKKEREDSNSWFQRKFKTSTAKANKLVDYARILHNICFTCIDRVCIIGPPYTACIVKPETLTML